MNHAFFYKSINGDRVYDDTSFEHCLKKFFTSGVFLNDLQVTANDDMTVSVGTGYVNADGKVKIYDEETTLQIATAGASYPRIDSIVLERNDTERDILLKVIKGGYSSEPVAHVPVRDGGVYQLVIAQILVDAGVVKITQANITDTRSNNELCGIVAGAVDQINFSQIQAQFDSYLEIYREYIADYAEQMQVDFERWFDNIKGQLSTDAAGHLQTQIDEMKEDMELLGGSKVEVNIEGGKNIVVGLTVNLEINGKTYTELVPQDKVAVFNGVLETGAANITIVDKTQGIDASVNVEIPYYGAYKVDLNCVSEFESWLNAAGYGIEQYPTVADVLADEKAVRKLMTVHASCDVFVKWYTKKNAMLAEFVENRVAMKWIGLRDYIADKIMAIPSALEQLLASEHWEYILKDTNPVMFTANSPEGTVSASSTFSGYNAHSAFDGKSNTAWMPVANANNTYLTYKFSKPHVVKKYNATMQKFNSAQYVNIELRASNDGVYWTTLDTFTSGETGKVINNDTPYLYYGIYSPEALAVEGVGYWEVRDLKFYGRSLNEAVPIMTSNIAPLGKCSCSSCYSANYDAFRAFEGLENSTTGWNPADSDKFGSAYVQYEFVKPVKVETVGALYKDTSGRTFTYKVMASNDGVEFTTIIESMTIKSSLTDFAMYETSADKAYKFYRFVYMSNSANAIGTGNGAKFQLYGVSYSEEECGTDGIVMLYDNGVKVGNVATFANTNANVIEAPDYVSGQSNLNTNCDSGITSFVNLTEYKYLIGEYNDRKSAYTVLFVSVENTTYGTANSLINANDNKKTIDSTLISGKIVLDIGALTEYFTVSLGQRNQSSKSELAKLRKFYLIKA